MQKTVMLEKVQMLPFALYRIVHGTGDSRLIRKTEATRKTDMQV